MPATRRDWQWNCDGSARTYACLLGAAGPHERTCQQAIADLRAELRYLEQPEALLAGRATAELSRGRGPAAAA